MKRGTAKHLECVHYKEIESVYHLFFECIVAKQVWLIVQKVFQVVVVDSECVARCWLCNKRKYTWILSLL